MTRSLVALTRPVGARLADCELTHLDRLPLDPGLAARQHDAYEAALRLLGCRVERLPDLPEHPDGVFIEDTLLILDEVAVITRPGAASRRDETADLGPLVEPFRSVELLRGPGTLDGGDVLRVGRTLFVGLSSRTSEDGIDELRHILSPLGYTVHPVPFSGCLHLKSAATAVSEHLVLLNPEWVDPAVFDGLDTLPVAPGEPFAANALRVGDSVIHPSAFPETRQGLENAGIAVLSVDISELARAEGGVTCCSVVFETIDQA